ncbi:hypothetical protein Agabi119p4_1359 [Agaricus bisporus var. burnettii]|uniref:Transmembrane protein n=1 Tax=Agaricus bisporus var. burnettii TaxID=192524 RepID=A0A8H7FCI6_AGABI|nr:hypothetical protein Agabi119p4_1359 [Agaricus bisporus var. burnettii]
MLSVDASVVLVVLAMIGGGLGRLETRDFTAPACEPPAMWTWMDNSRSMNPCKTVAYLQGACQGLTYEVEPLEIGHHYDPPLTSAANNTADACYCSWATYNLLSACTLCQGSQNGVLPWARWNSVDCAKYTSTTVPWPPEFNTTIPDDVTFPNWAAKDPTTWNDGRWNPAQASALASTEFGDYPLGTPTPSESSKSGGGSNAGAIAGGVVGGVIAVAIGIAVAVFLLCRARRRKAETEKTRDPDVMHHPVVYQHGHNPSDISYRNYGSNSGYTPLGHVSSPSNGSTFLQSPSTFLTHTSDRNSLAQESLLHSLGVAPSPPPQAASRALVSPQPQGSVSPFTGQPTSNPASGHDRKRSEVSQEMGSTEVPGRTQLNPPAYSETAGDRGDFSSQHPDQVSILGSSSIITTPSSIAQQTHHEKNASGSSMLSAGSHLTHPPNLGYWNQPQGSTSFSGAADMLNSSDTAPNVPTPSYVAPPGGVNMSVTRSEKQRPATATDTAPTERNSENR